MNRRELVFAVGLASVAARSQSKTSSQSTPSPSSTPEYPSISITTAERVEWFAMASPDTVPINALVYTAWMSNTEDAEAAFDHLSAGLLDTSVTDQTDDGKEDPYWGVRINTGELGSERVGTVIRDINMVILVVRDDSIVTYMRLAHLGQEIPIEESYADDLYPGLADLDPFVLVPESFPVGWTIVQEPTPTDELVIK